MMVWSELMPKLRSWRTNLFSGDAGNEAASRLIDMSSVLRDLVKLRDEKDRLERKKTKSASDVAQHNLRVKIAWNRARTLVTRIDEENELAG